MTPIKFIARGLVAGKIPLTTELIGALQDLAAGRDTATTTIITITEVPATLLHSDGTVPGPRQFLPRVQARTLPPRHHCRTGL